MKRLRIAAVVVTLLSLVVSAGFLNHRSNHRPQYWLRGSTAAPHQAGDRGEARFFSGYYLQQGRFGWSQVRLTRATEFDWPWGKAHTTEPSQGLLLASALGMRGAAGTWSITLWPFQLLPAMALFGLIGGWFVRQRRRAERRGFEVSLS